MEQWFVPVNVNLPPLLRPHVNGEGLVFLETPQHSTNFKKKGAKLRSPALHRQMFMAFSDGLHWIHLKTLSKPRKGQRVRNYLRGAMEHLPKFGNGNIMLIQCILIIFKHRIAFLLGQWLNFKLFGITYLVGKIKFKILFQGQLAKWALQSF